MDRAGTTVALYKGGARLARALPRPVAIHLGKAVGACLPFLMRGRAATVASHQQRILGVLDAPALRRQVRRAFVSYAQYWVDSFRLSGLTPADVDARFSVEGAEHVDAARAAGKGVIMAMPHLGTWDFGGAWFAARYPLTVVAEVLEPPALYEWFVSHRERLGMTVVPLGPKASSSLLSALKRNEVLGLLCDRDLDGNGVEVEFFGERTTMPAGPATLALRTGAVLLPNAAVYLPNGGVHGIIRPPIEFERTGRLRDDVAHLTQLVADALAELIRAYPEQWHVLQPQWPSDVGYPLR